jgi:hypothetical protein
VRRPHRLAVAAAIALAAAGGGVGVAVGRAPRSFAPVPADGGGAVGAGVRPLHAARPPFESVGAAGDLATIVAPEGAADTERERRRTRFDAPRVILDDPQPALGSAVAVAGVDRGGPRALELWRIRGGRSARVAIGESVAGGAVAFPPLVLPGGDVMLVAAPIGSGPDGPGASTPIAVRRDPSAPRVEVRESADGAAALHVVPAEPDGTIVVTTLRGAVEVERARAAVVAPVDGAPAALDLAIALAPGEGALRVAHELPDGRRSSQRSVVMTTPTPENAHAVTP